ncbi:pectate lyase superfamily protein-domain-containing protein, partial [Podospora didyma]
MFWARLAILLAVLLSSVVAELFGGQDYVGSAEQLAELERITADAQAKRAQHAADLLKQASEPAISALSASIDKNNHVTQGSLDRANEIVDAALAQWTSSYQKYILNPRKGSFKAGQGNSTKVKRRSPEVIRQLTTREEEVLSSAALLAEVEAAEKARNGTLHRDYTSKVPSDLFDRGTANSTVKRENIKTFWLEQLPAGDHGHAPFAGDPKYKVVFRNVKDYGAKGDGVTDDTKAINKAITDGKRCGADCLSSTTKPALVYFPGGTYLVSSTIIGYYQTQLVGNPNDRAVIKAASKFVGKDGTSGIISSDVYIDEGHGQKWYLETSNFYRQVRNLIIDIMDVKAENASCFHWQVAQATSIENVACYMSAQKDNTQRGIFCENGSGGWMANLEFQNGQIGIYGGEQQFTSYAMSFISVKTAVQLIWDWGWTFRSLYIGGADVAFKLFDDGGARGVGSVVIQDATISNCKTGVLTLPQKPGAKSGTTNVVLEMVAFDKVGKPVADTDGKVLLSGSDPIELTGTWSIGNVYVQGPSRANTMGDVIYNSGAQLPDTNRPGPLISDAKGTAWSSRWYRFQRKPQYQDLDVNSFINVMDYGVKGDGVTDDTKGFKAVFDFVFRRGGVIFIPHGVYLISETLEVSVGVRVVGECWSQLMAKGSAFSNLKEPKVFLRAGIPKTGSIGLVEMSDLIITTKGVASQFAGVEWNIQGVPGFDDAPGMYDVHFRIGGATGTDMQVSQCPQGKGTECKAGLMLMHITPQGSGYFQNVWVWVADHDIDDEFNDRINIHVARGWLIESTKPTWMYGTASEHAVLYQYSFNNARTVGAGMIQTESAYFQGMNGIRSPAPYQDSLGQWPGDPVYPEGGCVNGTIGCDSSWAVVMLNSSSIVVDGAGLYSWFNAYDESCVDSWNCQESLVQIGRGSGDIAIKNLITIGSNHMVS